MRQAQKKLSGRTRITAAERLAAIEAEIRAILRAFPDLRRGTPGSKGSPHRAWKARSVSSGSPTRGDFRRGPGRKRRD
jgi:hypothetical protein